MKFDYLLHDTVDKHKLLFNLIDNNSLDIDSKRNMLKDVSYKDCQDFIKKYFTIDNITINIDGAVPFRKITDVSKLFE